MNEGELVLIQNGLFPEKETAHKRLRESEIRSHATENQPTLKIIEAPVSPAAQPVKRP
jgi:hypothetical protein